MVHRIVSRVASEASLDFWADRLEREGVEVDRSGDGVIFSDFEGLTHELVVNTSGDEPLTAVHPEIPEEHALQGFEGVRAYSDDTATSRALLEQVLGAVGTGDDSWELRGERRGGWIAYDPAPMDRGRQSAGTVHHIAWGTTVAEHPRWQEHLSDVGVPTSGIIDRHYFHSIYFREPSGVLFEIADDGPGFTVDVPLAELGSRIILPPRFEAHREEIERRLTPLADPRADWAVDQPVR
jgi:glyoxalase family protein